MKETVQIMPVLTCYTCFYSLFVDLEICFKNPAKVMQRPGRGCSGGRYGRVLLPFFLLFCVVLRGCNEMASLAL